MTFWRSTKHILTIHWISIGCININSIGYNFAALYEVFKKGPVDILFVNKTKLDSSFPDAWLKIDGYQFPSFRKDRNAKGGGKITFIRQRLIVKRLKFLKPKLLKQFAQNWLFLRGCGASFLFTNHLIYRSLKVHFWERVENS